MINNDKSRLFLYVTLSLIIHLLLFYFFPFGYLEGFSNEDAQGENFGYVQLVEYQSNSNQDVEEQKEIIKDEEPVEEPKPEEEPNKEVEEEPETKTEEEDVQIKEEVITEEEEIDTEQEQEIEEEVIEETETANNQEQKVITSEESDIEIEVKQEESSQNEEETEEIQEVEEEVVEEPAPPPPPTAGELIGLSPKPVYPKYLVSEARSGEVGLNVTINQNGEIENIVITRSSNIESMDRNAKLTVENGWQFKSYKQRYQIDVTVIFNIDDSGNPNVDVQIGNVNFL